MSKCCNANINYIEPGENLSTDSSGKFWADCEKLTGKCEEVKLTEKPGLDSIESADPETCKAVCMLMKKRDRQEEAL